MGNKRTRDRQLAKLAARRHQERAAAKRRRDIILGVVGTLIAALLIVGGFRVLTGDDDETADTDPNVSPSALSTGAPEPAGEVTPQVQPPDDVACGGEVPPEAGSAKPQFDRVPGIDLLDPDLRYRATIATSCGDVVVDLDASRAPQAVASFVFLAREGFYDGLTFHRIVPGFVIQAGDPLGDGTGGPGYTLAEEISGRMRYTEGTLAMAKSAAPNTTGSQWFVVSGPDGSNLEATPDYTIFGEVVEGMDVVSAIDAVPVDGDAPTQAVYIEAVTIRERPAPVDEPAAVPSETDSP